MPSERVQRQIDRLLDEAESAAGGGDWALLKELTERVLTLDPENTDALALRTAAQRGLAGPGMSPPPTPSRAADSSAQPNSFANGRYIVKRFLGEGGKKKVYLAHDSQLDRDVAFALIKTEGLDDEGRVRIQREAQAMGRLGNHPNIVTVYDIGDEAGQPYLVLPILSGGDVEGVIENAPEHKLPLEQALKIAIETCQGLEMAHGIGIIHRDLKPGNVWLTGEGRVMIGDFGLAIAADRSRLTQAGMMVGTVSYMPPEQAMGGEITPRSDLYSLGAMLYEMICGRPPFVGDESVAIIGQHLNTPPVAPTWHRPDCPTSLERLILRLLEKDPNKRPENAIDVRRALESITGTRPTSASPVETTAAVPVGENPLYRRTFVGRENEVKQLQAAFDAAVSGQGGLVMVVGEPGIGKTAICEQLATYVALRGGKALVGHFYEEGSLSLPYLAFVEAMRSYVLAREPDGLRSDLGTGAADIARIVSEVRDRVQGVELRPSSDPEDDRWRLLQSVTSFLRNASTVQPLVIVLEDLHWADRGTLDLLLHVSRNLEGARLLIVGTYRDVEVDRSHPLSGVLADLRRSANFSRVPLRGLTVDEVHRMYEALRGQTTPWAQAEAVHRQTEGNPLFVQEVLRYLVEEGLVVREGGRYVPQVDPGVGIPEGLRDVVGKRLSHLSEGCNRLLSVAAVIGRDFDLQTLRGVSNLSEDELFSSIEEAVKVGVLEERSMPGAVRYRFAHAFFRQSLYEEMIAPRRLRLHQEVARALEAQYASRREEHAAELAEHYGQSTDRADLAKAVEYSELAAKRAMSVFAYAESEEHLKRCLDVQEVLDPDDKSRRLDLLLGLSDAILPQENPGRLTAVAAGEAFALAVEVDDHSRAAQAAVRACESIIRSGMHPDLMAEIETWATRLDRYAADGTLDRVYADIFLGSMLLVKGQPATAHNWIRKAVHLAEVLGDDRAFFAAAMPACMLLASLRDFELIEHLAHEIIGRPKTHLRAQDSGFGLQNLGRIRLGAGDREDAERAWQETTLIAERTGEVALQLLSRHRTVYEALLDGRLEDVLELSKSIAEQAREIGSRLTGPNSLLQIEMKAAVCLGVSAEEYIEAYEGSARVPRMGRARALAYTGRTQEALTIFRETFRSVTEPNDESASMMVISWLEIGLLAKETDLMEPLVQRLRPLARSVSPFVGHSVGRLLGEACAFLGRPIDARGFYAQGIEACQKIRYRPELALIRLDLAELLLEHYPDERAAAIEHLDFAIGEFQAMKMQPTLERALRHRGLLKA